MRLRSPGPLHDPAERHIILSVSAKTFADPRSVLAELRALRGEGPHVRGHVGQRIRHELARLGCVPTAPEHERDR